MATPARLGARGVDRLVRMYRRAQRDIVFEMKTATDYRRGELIRIQQRIEEHLGELAEARDPLIDQMIAENYQRGFDRAVGGLRSIEGRNISAEFSVIDHEAIAAIVDEVKALLGEADQGAMRHSIRMLQGARAEAALGQIARGKIMGETLRDITKRIEKELEIGAVILRDSAGRRWSMDTYAEMLARTTNVKAANQGMANKMMQHGDDLVTVSIHNSDHEECYIWEGEILSLTGMTTEVDGNPVATVEEAESGGLFHPNCKHRLLPYHRNIMAELPGNPEALDDQVVWRAVDSETGLATLGDGVYFARHKENSVRYGQDIRPFKVKKGTRFMRLQNTHELDRVTQEAIKKNRKEFFKRAQRDGENEAMGWLIRNHARQEGFHGIIGDDQVFGSVVFNPRRLVEQ